MTNWKINFLESAILGQKTNKSNADIVLAKCIELAYTDMMDAVRYYSKYFSESKDIICNKTKDIMSKTTFYLLDVKLTKYQSYFLTQKK